MSKPVDFAALAAEIELDALPPPLEEIIRAARIWAICARIGRNPCNELTRRFGSGPAARHFVVLMALVVAAWPEPFRIPLPAPPRRL